MLVVITFFYKYSYHNMMTSLPFQVGGFYQLPGEYEYDGLVLNISKKREHLDYIRDELEYRSGDILSVGFPKSGRKLVHYNPKITTSWYGNGFRITGPLWGESTGYRWIPLTNGK